MTEFDIHVLGRNVRINIVTQLYCGLVVRFSNQTVRNVLTLGNIAVCNLLMKTCGMN